MPLPRCLAVLSLALSLASAAIKIPLDRVDRNVPTASHSRRRSTTFPEAGLDGFPAAAYSLTMEVGDPSQAIRCVIDTGSSNLAVSGITTTAQTYYYQDSATSICTNEEFTVNYQVASWTAVLCQDYVGIYNVPDTTIKVEFGMIVQQSNFFSPDAIYSGILGLAYPSLALPQSQPIAPYLNVLAEGGNYNTTFAVQLCDSQTVDTQGNGFLTLGGYNNDETYSGSNLLSARVVPSAETYYSVTVMRMRVGNTILNQDCSVYNSPAYAIVDSGTTDLLVPPAVASEITSLLNSYVPHEYSSSASDWFSGQLCMPLTLAQVLDFPSVYVSVQSYYNVSQAIELQVPPYHYLRIADINGTECRFFSILSTTSLGVTLGAVALDSFVVVFNQEAGMVQFATSTCASISDTDHSSLEVLTSYITIPGVNGTSDCQPSSSKGGGSDIDDAWIYITVGVGVGVLVLVCSYLGWKYIKWRRLEQQGAYNAFDRDPETQVGGNPYEPNPLVHTDGAVDFKYTGGTNSR